MVFVINKEVDDKEFISWCIIAFLSQKLHESKNQPDKVFISWCIIALLNHKLNESRNQPIQNPPRFAELPKRTRSIQVCKLEIQPPKGKERDHAEGSRTSQETEWIININLKLQQASDDDEAGWAKLCIYRIPQCLLNDGNDKAYIPQVVSLGPYHHGKKPPLCDMDPHKWRALRRILNRNNQRIELYLKVVKEHEKKARSCYEGTISLNSNEFTEMMVLDSCFMLELFRGAAEGFVRLGYSKDDPIFARRVNLNQIQRDMMMLENQIPLFILGNLLSIQTDKAHQKEDVITLALRFFNNFVQDESPTMRKLNKPKLTDRLHCLEIFRRNLLTAETEPPPRSHSDIDGKERLPQFIHCVTELKQAGIKFKRRETDRFWDIKFRNGVLEIPRLLIHDGTKSLFHNLIAYEQRHRNCTNEITSYAIFMDSLINTAADVSYLHHKEIVENWLGNDDNVAELFNGLCKEVSFDSDNSYLCTLTGEVNDYYNGKCHVLKASLRHRYFNSPWATISFIAAVMLLSLTSLQTFFTVYPYYIKHS